MDATATNSYSIHWRIRSTGENLTSYSGDTLVLGFWDTRDFKSLHDMLLDLLKDIGLVHNPRMLARKQPEGRPTSMSTLRHTPRQRFVPCSWRSGKLSEALLERARLETPLRCNLHPATTHFPKLLLPLWRLDKSSNSWSPDLFPNLASPPLSFFSTSSRRGQHGSPNSNVAKRHLPRGGSPGRDQAMGELVGKVQGPLWQAARICCAESGACQHHWRGRSPG